MSIFNISCGVREGFQLISSGFELMKKYVITKGQLDRHIDTLQTEVHRLEMLMEQTKVAVTYQKAQQPQTKGRPEVKLWRQNAAVLLCKKDELVGKVTAKESSFLGRFSYYKLATEADDLLQQVKDLEQERGTFGDSLVHRIVEEIIASSHTITDTNRELRSTNKIIGHARTLDDIRYYIKDDGVGIVGIWGISGIGKTTLMRAIKEEAAQQQVVCRTLVIWVQVSKDWSAIDLQKNIAKQLDLPYSSDNVTILSDRLNNYLKRINFLIFLDNLWNAIDLQHIGIPVQHAGKVIFTTQLEKICRDMECRHIVHVDFLNEEESWELFCRKAGTEAIRQPTINPLAKSIAAQCRGLPLALSVVGRSMSQVNDYQCWLDAKKQLEEAPRRFVDVDTQILTSLRFSFDRLENDIMRSCLLYCALFPEDQYIDKEELIEYYIGEGLLDFSHNAIVDIDTAYREGRHVIRKLSEACLLEKDTPDGFEKEYVKLHYWVREMALWITTNKFFVSSASRNGAVSTDLWPWNATTKISLIETDVLCSSLDKNSCSNLETLISKQCGKIGLHILERLLLGKFPSHFRLLDMRGLAVKYVPYKIDKLQNLQYLNLSGTSIFELPESLGLLRMLRILNLRYTSKLVVIPVTAISKLTNLQKLDLWQSGYCDTLLECRVSEPDKDNILDELNRLDSFQDLRIIVPSFGIAEKLAIARLRGATRWVTLADMSAKAQDISGILFRLPMLHTLVMQNVGAEDEDDDPLRIQGTQYLQHLTVEQSKLTGIQVVGTLPALRVLIIHNCCYLTHLRFVSQLPNLEKLSVSYCPLLQSLFPADNTEETPSENCCGLFEYLKALDLADLPLLTCISNGTLQFTSLLYLEVLRCESLTELPFEDGSAMNIRKIRGGQQWWDALQQSPPDRLSSCFIPWP